MNSEADMGFKLIAFRCPSDLLERLDRLASATNSSRSVIIAEAVRVFAEEVRARGGYIVPLPTHDMDAGETLEAKSNLRMIQP